MSSLSDKIATFYKKRNDTFRKPLEKIINNMLDKCRYINGESLERHNWGNKPLKLKYIPQNIKSPSFEEDLLNALNLDENEKSNIELLWGDIQLGKRVHACIIMWISVYILKRPVLYIFRNLSIDQKQLQDDIMGTENYNFNIQFIKNLFEEFNTELQEYFEETNIDYHKDYKLPELKDINSNDIMSKLSNKEAINSSDIFCCLMNHTQLEKISSKFSEYIHYNHELVDMSVLVDESDLMSPTSSNDRSNDNDKKDSTACEKLLAKIYKKVKYVLHITGTAHSLLYNITTRLSDNTDIQIKVSKVHKMKRSNDYFGLFNSAIKFNTTSVVAWWDYQDEENNKSKYDIITDYNINIKKIIEEICGRTTTKYNSLLISEEKIRIKQFILVNKILSDFPNLFIIIFHGNCLMLYLSKDYEKQIKQCAMWDAQQCVTSQRLWQSGGVYGSSIDTEHSKKLPNNYCYFKINTKILNIKFVYKLLRILFEQNVTHIKHKSVITITGKYGERGYSFTSDDYDNYSFHLTDQYFVSHSTFNCTDISQRARLQGKYNDNELKNGAMKLTLWTTPELHDVIQNFYVKFIKEIERFIMGCDTWEDIKDLIESIIDNGEFKFGKYMKYIDVSKKRKNLKPMKHFDKKNNGYRLILTDELSDSEITAWCEKSKLPAYNCVNEIKEDMTKDEFVEKYKNKCKYIIKTEYFTDINSEICINFCKKNGISFPDDEWFKSREEHKDGNIYKDKTRTEWKPLLLKDIDGMYNAIQDRKRRWYYGYEDNSFTKLFYVVQYNDTIKENLYHSSPIKNKISYLFDSNIVKYSVLKEEYRQTNTQGYSNEDEDDDFIADGGLPSKYYWKTPDGWLYLYDKDKPEIISLNIVSPIPIASETQHTLPLIDSSSLDVVTTPLVTTPLVASPLIDKDVLLFTHSCFKLADKHNLRFGLSDIYKIYEDWCKLNNKKCLKIKKKFKEELAKLNYKEDKSKGVDIHNNPGKRGYHIMVSL